MKKITSILMVALFFIASCASMNPANLETPHARARFVNVTYVAAYNDHVRITQMENLTPEAMELMNTKREILMVLQAPISILNGYVATGNVPDALYEELLQMLLELETGWYTQAQIQKDALDEALMKLIRDAGIMDEVVARNAEAQMDPIFLGVLIELLRTGVHALRAMLSQRNLDAVQMKTAWEESLAQFRAADPTLLKEF
jgi:hypothetical protein